jgi:hypothetical protein
MAEAFRQRRLTAEVQIQSQFSSCETDAGQSGTRTGFSTSTSVFPLSVVCLQCSILIYTYTFLVPQRQAGLRWEPTKEQRSFSKSGNCGRKRTSAVFRLEWCDTQQNRRCWLTDCVMCRWQRSRGPTLVRRVDGKCFVLPHHGAADSRPIVCFVVVWSYCVHLPLHDAEALATLCSLLRNILFWAFGPVSIE